MSAEKNKAVVSRLLKELVADLSLEAYRLKKTGMPMPQYATDTRR